MNYSKFLNEEEIKNNFKILRKEDKVNSSGLPIYYENDSLYYDDSNRNNLIIGNAFSNKNELIFLPMLKMSILAGESILCIDRDNELLNNLNDLLVKNDYIILDKIKYNPLTIPYELYKVDRNKALDMLKIVSEYIFNLENNTKDPFWINMSRDYFMGLVIYLFKTKGKITLNDILNFGEKIMNDGLELEKNSMEDVYLSNTLKAPTETKKSIFSVFKQKLKYYAINDTYNQEFDLNILNKKFAVFDNSNSSLNSLFINQLIECRKQNNMLHIILNSLDNIYPLNNIVNYLFYNKNYNIKFSMSISGINLLKEKYGKEDFESIICNIGNIVYLLSSEIDTLDYFAQMCGKDKKDNLIESTTDLMGLKENEAIILVPRFFPIKTKLIPYSSC